VGRGFDGPRNPTANLSAVSELILNNGLEGKTIKVYET
jgi:hypothetical protein